jgi:hypothetical protein
LQEAQISVKTTLLCAAILTLATAGTAHSAQQNDLGATRPGPKGQPTTVHVGIFVFDVTDVDDVEQTFTADVIVHLRWSDPRLAAEADESRTLDLAEVWHPRIQIVNERRAFRKLTEQVNATPEGGVTYRQRFSGTFVVPLDLRDFPADKQVLPVRLVFPDHGEQELQLEIDTETTGRSPIFNIPDWTIGDGKSRVDPVVFTPGMSKASVLYELKAHRQIQYYYLNVLVPLVLIVCMSWAAFWIDPENSGSQIGVATSSILTLIAYRFMLGNLLPKLGYMTRLDYFILASTILVFVTLIEVLITTALVKANRASEARRCDIWCRWLFPAAFLMLIGVMSL